jgi:iron complex outermembrane receptor protein
MVQVLVKKSFINATASFQLRGQTGRAKDATGNLFNAFNAIEQRTNINSLFGNINTPNSTQILGLIKPMGATSKLLLNFDATSGELAYRKLENFNMKVGQSSLQSSVLLNGAYPITENLEVYALGY